MEKNKNFIIGGLIAIVLVMAVGYAAFATQLNIASKAVIGDGDDTNDDYWNVHFDTDKKTGAGVIDTTTGLTGAQAPTGTITYTGDLTANLTANLNQPGDKVKFTLTILNTGKLKAKNDTLTLAGDGTVSGLTYTEGNIKFTVTNPADASLAAKTGTTTMTVTAEFTEPAANSVVSEQTSNLTITVPYVQDTTA